jgi:hypothetical protein
MKTQDRKEVELSEEQKVTIYCLAEGDLTHRADAEKIFMENIAAHVQGGRVSDFMNFLSEVFNKCPDAMLKKMYRDRILRTIPPGVSYSARDDRFYFNTGAAMSTHFWRSWIERRAEFPQHP